jgi:hypothetical protein
MGGRNKIRFRRLTEEGTQTLEILFFLLLNLWLSGCLLLLLNLSGRSGWGSGSSEDWRLEGLIDIDLC